MGNYVPLKPWLSISNQKDFKFFFSFDVCDFEYGPKTPLYNSKKLAINKLECRDL
jgi:hypothetical protein